MPTDEEKLLAILNQPEPKYAHYEPDHEDGISAEVAEIPEDRREVLTKILNSSMPSPEEIIRDAKIAEHNAAVQKKREERLAARRARQAKPPKQPKSKKRRRKR